MGFLSGLLGLPLVPVRGVGWIAERVLEEAERQYYDPGTIRRKLEEVADAKAAGTLTAEEASALEQELVGRLIEAGRRARREG
ncbi:gas vesicle protein GvpG [Arthrobacter sp. I2-34]|uniref:Gas vesicle protein GvpG n=1 Tax=Arthrobacter hankyongi TaxID=2904801 RepID=A0ABS9L813_9MICC|nr:gas vesicle protein GvpG [Arthrobacter hankyongi]MCG2622761.1 gas vesicle protein GvpG [Arthrobacter hankyongi]